MKPYVNKALRALIHALWCQVELDDCLVKPAVPCHMNGVMLGKGIGRKAHDCFMFAGCSAGVGTAGCHFEIDDGKRLSEDEKKRHSRVAFVRTFTLLQAMGKIILPVMSYDEYMASRAVKVAWPYQANITMTPAFCTDDEWLNFWLEGQARVA